MGVHKNVGFEKTHYPKQGKFVGRAVKVCFRYDTTKTLDGVIVRDDREEPGHTIIRLEDGRHVLGAECMYSVPVGNKATP